MHLTDEQINEYLDDESNEREYIDAHLASCADCAARLTAFQMLFAELDSLPELMLSSNLAARFTPTPSLPLQLPRWLTLTATLQAALALIVLMLAAPFVETFMPAIETPSLTEILIQAQSLWLALFKAFTNLQLPTMPSFPPLQIPALTLSLALTATSLLWLVGNGLLLRRVRRT